MWEKFFSEAIYWIIPAVVCGGMLLWDVLRSPSKKDAVSIDVATDMINQQGAWVIDVRPKDIVEKGRFPNARAIPLPDLQTRIKELEKAKDKPIVVVCDSGVASLRAVKILRAEGFEQVVCVLGGLNAWVQAGLILSSK